MLVLVLVLVLGLKKEELRPCPRLFSIVFEHEHEHEHEHGYQIKRPAPSVRLDPRGLEVRGVAFSRAEIERHSSACSDEAEIAPGKQLVFRGSRLSSWERRKKASQ